MHYSDSILSESGICHEKSEGHSRPPNHRKSDSYAAPAAQRRSGEREYLTPKEVDRLQDAKDGVDTRALQHYLGHRNITHTVLYIELRSDRFDGFWKD